MVNIYVILCEDFEDAQKGFEVFMDYLETFESESIYQVFEYSYCVETDDRIRYIFVDHRFEKLFLNMDKPNIDIIIADEFFDSLYDYYEDKEYWKI